MHSIPGRVGLPATAPGVDALGALAQQFVQEEGVLEVIPNKNTGSLLVSFDLNKLASGALGAVPRARLRAPRFGWINNVFIVELYNYELGLFNAA